MTPVDKNYRDAMGFLLAVAGELEALCKDIVMNPATAAANIDTVVDLEYAVVSAARVLVDAQDKMHAQVRAERGFVAPTETVQ